MKTGTLTSAMNIEEVRTRLEANIARRWEDIPGMGEIHRTEKKNECFADAMTVPRYQRRPPLSGREIREKKIRY